jgi:hypothetical protein
MIPRRQARLLCLLGLLAVAPLARAGESKPDSAVLIDWLLQDGRELKGIPFSEVLAATTGKKILPVPPDAPWIKRLAAVLDRTLSAMNDPSHPIHRVGRINEASRFIEDQLMLDCNKEAAGPAASRAPQQAMSNAVATRICALFSRINPWFFSTSSSSRVDQKPARFATFYYEPKSTTSKVQDDAHHLLVGVQHNGGEGGQIRFEEWDLVDVSKIEVQLKAEFQATNKDIYRRDTILL